MLRAKIATTAALTATVIAAVAMPAPARMKSTQVGPGLCLTKGGGRFVDIPGFPGERIDRRLLRDVRLLQRRYRVFVTDGFSTSPVHSPNGEHPIGLALDIVPDKSKGGRWRDIGSLARWAEPKQNAPIAPFRWVGYDGDANHGRGHHLHLSWSHSPAQFGKPARSVYTIRCPKRRMKATADDKPDKPDKPKPEDAPKPSGGTGSGIPPKPSGGTGSGTLAPSGPSGGVTPRLAPPVVETDGVDRS